MEVSCGQVLQHKNNNRIQTYHVSTLPMWCHLSVWKSHVSQNSQDPRSRWLSQALQVSLRATRTLWANMNVPPGSATVYILAKHIVLTLPFWARFDCLVFQTLRWNHMSSLKTCDVFPLLLFLRWGTWPQCISIVWNELPSPKLILGGVD